MFVRYFNAPAIGDWRQVAGVYGTQALADAAVNGDAAYMGDVVGTDATLYGLTVGWWVKTTALVAGEKRVQRHPPTSAETAFQRQVISHRKLHDTGVVLEEIAREVSLGFPDSARQKFHDILFRVRQYHYIIAHDNTNDRGIGATVAAREAVRAGWHAKMLGGPANIRVAFSIVDGVPVSTSEQLRDAVHRFFRQASITTGNGVVSTPTRPSAWVAIGEVAADLAMNPDGDSSRKNIHQMDDFAIPPSMSQELATADLSGGTWIDSLQPR